MEGGARRRAPGQWRDAQEAARSDWPFDLLIGQPKFVRATWRDDVLEDRPGTDALLCFRDMAALQSKIITMHFYHRDIAEKFGFLTLFVGLREFDTLNIDFIKLTLSL